MQSKSISYRQFTESLRRTGRTTRMLEAVNRAWPTFGEGYSIVVLGHTTEAARGLAVMFSRTYGGTPEIVNDKYRGAIIKKPGRAAIKFMSIQARCIDRETLRYKGWEGESQQSINSHGPLFADHHAIETIFSAHIAEMHKYDHAKPSAIEQGTLLHQMLGMTEGDVVILDFETMPLATGGIIKNCKNVFGLDVALEQAEALQAKFHEIFPALREYTVRSDIRDNMLRDAAAHKANAALDSRHAEAKKEKWQRVKVGNYTGYKIGRPSLFGSPWYTIWYDHEAHPVILPADTKVELVPEPTVENRAGWAWLNGVCIGRLIEPVETPRIGEARKFGWIRVKSKLSANIGWRSRKMVDGQSNVQVLWDKYPVPEEVSLIAMDDIAFPER